MTSPEKLSVLLPVYNTRSDWLSIAIESVLNQTHRDFELLLLNDGSTDPDTLATLAAFEKADDRVRLIHNPENMGLAKTLNRGLTLARYDWVARMDGDDIAEPQRFERQLAYLRAHPDISILGSDLRTFGDKQEIFHYAERHEDITTSMLWGCSIPHPTVMYRKAAILAAGGYPTDYPNAEDYALWSKIVSHHPDVRFAIVPEVLFNYRVTLSRPEYYAVQQESTARIKETLFTDLGLPNHASCMWNKPTHRLTGAELREYEETLSRDFATLKQHPGLTESLIRERLCYIIRKAVKRALPSPYALRRVGSLLFRREAYLDSLFPLTAPTKAASDSLYSK